MYDYNCPDCNEAKLQTDRNARKINEIIGQVNQIVDNDIATTEYLLKKADEIVGEKAEEKVNAEISNINAEINKINSSVDIERKRIDSFTRLPEGSTTGDAEIVDARIGSNGIIYDNLGTAIRQQNDEINRILDVGYTKEKINFISELIDTKIYADGWMNLNNDTNYLAKKIRVKGGEKILVTTMAYHTKFPVIVFFDVEEPTGKANTSIGSVTVDGVDGQKTLISQMEINVPGNAKYAYINSYSFSDIVVNRKVKEKLSDYSKNKVDLGISDYIVYESELNKGYISVIDGSSSQSSSRRYCKIDVSDYDTIMFNYYVDVDSLKVGYVFTDENNTFISGTHHDKNEEIIVDIPSNAKYFIYSAPTNTWSVENLFKLCNKKDTFFGIQQEIKELFQYVSDGKKLIASTITDKGISTDANAEFKTMAQNIKSLSSSDETVLATFAVISDTHYYKNYDGVNKLNKAIENLQKHNFDFLVNCGDVGTFAVIGDEGVSRNIVDLYNYLNTINYNIPTYYIRGNHDQTTTDEKWVEYLGNEPNLYFERNGDLYIFLSMDFSTDEQSKSYTKAIQFLKSINVSNKRCFLFIHYPYFGKSGLVNNEEYGWSSTSPDQFEIYNYFNKSLITFNGHTHYCFETEEEYNHPFINVFNDLNNKVTIHCPSTGYARNGDGTVIEDKNVVKGWFVDVYKKGIRLRGIDLYNDKFLENYVYHINTN